MILFADYLGRILFFLADAVRWTFLPPFLIGETIRQMYLIGVKSLPLTSIAALAIGLVLAMQTIWILSKFGAVNYLAAVVGLAIVKELGPVVTALMVAGRAGSGISAELGSMKVTRQIDALRVSAVNPTKYLVTTRVLACMICLPLLTVFADALGILGGWVIGISLGGINSRLYWDTTLRYITLDADLIPGLLKTVFFGLIIGVVACFHGFSTEGGTEGVGLSTTTTVVSSSLMILISDVFLTRLLQMIFEGV
jgi:phospholipid/cholesterol/gamma-HCH transport system permease protein